MFALAGLHHVHLRSSGRKRARILAARSEQQKLGDIAKVEAHASPVRTAILADLVPDDVGFVGEAPSAEHLQAIGQQRIRNPDIAMGFVGQMLGDG